MLLSQITTRADCPAVATGYGTEAQEIQGFIAGLDLAQHCIADRRARAGGATVSGRDLPADHANSADARRG